MTKDFIEETVEALSTKITDYGYNDEYEYYNDWKDGVTPIIREALQSQRTEMLRRVEEVKEEAKKHPMKNNIGEMTGWNNGYDQALTAVRESLLANQ